MRWLPHFLTLLRLVAAPVVVGLLVTAHYRTALVVVLLAGLTDWFDGYAARQLGASGTLGVVLDPLADKVLLVTLFLAIGYLRLIPLWLPLMAVARDLIIVGGVLLLRIYRNRRKFVPSILGKVSTFFQIVLILLVLVHASFPNPAFLMLQDIAVFSTAIFTGVSGLEYIWRGIQMAMQPPLQPPLQND